MVKNFLSIKVKLELKAIYKTINEIDLEIKIKHYKMEKILEIIFP